MKHGGFWKPHCWHNVTKEQGPHGPRTHRYIKTHNGLSEKAVHDEQCCECGATRVEDVRYEW